MFILLITVAVVSVIASILNCIFSGSLLIFINRVLVIFLNIILLTWIIKYFGKAYISEVRKQFRKIWRHFRR